MKKGIVYCASNQGFADECEISAKRVKQLHNDLHITLVADASIENLSDCFDHIVRFDKNFLGVFPYDNFENPHGRFNLKMFSYLASPYEHTIYLDSDTYMLNDEPYLYEMFEITSEYDFAACIEPMADDMFQLGVCSFKNNYDFLINWLKVHVQYTEPCCDQSSLRTLLSPSGKNNKFDLNAKVLHHSWNWRDRKINGRLSDTTEFYEKGLHKQEIKILHNRWRLLKMKIFTSQGY